MSEIHVISIRNTGQELALSYDELLAAAGYGPDAQYWEVQDGIVSDFLGGASYREEDINREAANLIRRIKNWFKKNGFQALLRKWNEAVKQEVISAKGAVWQQFQLWRCGQSSEVEIIRLKPGDVVSVVFRDYEEGDSAFYSVRKVFLGAKPQFHNIENILLSHGSIEVTTYDMNGPSAVFMKQMRNYTDGDARKSEVLRCRLYVSL